MANEKVFILSVLSEEEDHHLHSFDRVEEKLIEFVKNFFNKTEIEAKIRLFKGNKNAPPIPVLISDDFPGVRSENNNEKEIEEFIEKLNNTKEEILLIFLKPVDFAVLNTFRAFKGLKKDITFNLYFYEHPVFYEPYYGDISIWRYLSLAKFIDLLQTKALYFPNIKKMQEFDKQEGIPSEHLKNLIVYNDTVAAANAINSLRFNPHLINDRILKELQDAGISEEEVKELFNKSTTDARLIQICSKSKLSITKEKVEEILKNQLDNYYINCWHINKNENFAMWKIYSDPSGVCIRSNVYKLKKCLWSGDFFKGTRKSIYWRDNCKDISGMSKLFNGNMENFKNQVFIGEVRYVPNVDKNEHYKKGFINSKEFFVSKMFPNHKYAITMFKREEFAYEKELRCFIFNDEKKEDFLRVEVNIQELIDKIYIHPNAPKRFKETIENLCSVYGLNINSYNNEFLVNQSNLS